jgi:hypothetical protein
VLYQLSYTHHALHARPRRRVYPDPRAGPNDSEMIMVPEALTHWPGGYGQPVCSVDEPSAGMVPRYLAAIARAVSESGPGCGTNKASR